MWKYSKTSHKFLTSILGIPFVNSHVFDFLNSMGSYVIMISNGITTQKQCVHV